MKIGITGDTHGNLRFTRIYQARKLGLTHLIICGDFGYVWQGGLKESKRLKFLSNIGVTILFLDGNHDNHDILNEYPINERYGGKVHLIEDNIFHLIRGEIYTLNNNTFFAFGGANSVDKDDRKEGKNWWQDEKPSCLDELNALNNLEHYKYKVDYILTHTSYPLALHCVGGDSTIDDVSYYLNSIRLKVDFKYWFFGHMHKDFDIKTLNTRCIYEDIVCLN